MSLNMEHTLYTCNKKMSPRVNPRTAARRPPRGDRSFRAERSHDIHLCTCHVSHLTPYLTALTIGRDNFGFADLPLVHSAMPTCTICVNEYLFVRSWSIAPSPCQSAGPRLLRSALTH